MPTEGLALDSLDAPTDDGAGRGDPSDPSELDEAVVAACGGDEHGFSLLWRALHPSLLRYLTVRGEEAPEDLAAETWVHAVRGLPTFEGTAADFRSWLFAIARNRAVDHGRARSRRPRTVAVEDPGEVSPPEPSPSAEQHATDNESTARAMRLVATLPPAQAEMVALRVIAGLDVAEVARLVGKRPGTVRVTVHRALRSLAEHPELRSARKAV